MGPEGKTLQPRREQTDESLRAERARSDAELTRRLTVIEDATNKQVEDAREIADEALVVARDEADQRGVGDAAPTAKIAEARAEADAALEHERTVADEKVRREREERVHLLLRLLPLEREKTDQHLLTERDHADEAISNRDDFLSIVSHDLRNLLATVAMSSQRIEGEASGKPGESPTLEEAKRIRRVVGRMTRLVADLADVSSIESGSFAVEPKSGDVTSLIAEALDAFEPSAAAKGVSFAAGRVDASLRALFDRDRVFQVLANLIGNAIKFTPAGGEIRIDGARVGNAARLSVRDTGPGIPSEVLEAVFERFWQVGKNDKRGLGLGLYIARGIVEAQRGRIWAESVLGEGSAFHFTLPMADAPTSERQLGTTLRQV